MHEDDDDVEILTFLHNVPRSLSLTSVEKLVNTLSPQAADIKVLQQRGTLCVQFAVSNATERATLLKRPCRKLDKHYLYLSMDGPDPDDTTASFECSGKQGMESLREALGTCAGSHEAPSSEPDAKELSPSSSSSPSSASSAASASPCYI